MRHPPRATNPPSLVLTLLTLAPLVPLALTLPLFAVGEPPASAAEAPGRRVVPEAVSLLGAPLVAPALPPETAERYETKLQAARRAWHAAPDDLDALIWLGRRTAYLGRYRHAIETYSLGLSQHPGEPRLLRHRGHRYITLRQLDAAIADLTEAARLMAGSPDRVEEDGLPNARGIPTSTLHTNVWYHLALAHYVTGDFAAAATNWRHCLDAAGNPDMRVAASYWLYLSLRRLGRDDEAAAVLAPISADLDIIENHAYHRLLLLYRGDLDGAALQAEAFAAGDRVESASLAYGIGAWHLLAGREAEAHDIWRRIVASDGWAAFGHLAAEAELARSGDGGNGP